MPTTNPRLNVTLSPSLYSLVERLAVLQRVSRAQVLRELLEAGEPALQRAAALMEAAAKAKVNATRGLANELDRAQRKIEDTLGQVLDRIEAGPDLVSVAEAVGERRPVTRRAAAGRRVVQDPPASKRGVKTSGEGKKGGKR